MSLSIKDGAGATKVLATGAGDGSVTPFQSPVSVAVGAQADAAASSDTGTFSVLSLVKRALQNWTTLLARVPAQGQAVAASSLPVVLPAAQLTSLTAPAVTGNVADAAADSGNPVLVGAVFKDDLPTYTDGQRGRLHIDVNGALLVNPGLLDVQTARATITGTTATQIVAAVTGKRIRVLGYSLQVRAAGTPVFNFQDDAGTPVVLSREWQLDQSGTVGPNGIIRGESLAGCGVDSTTSGQALMGKLSAAVSTVVEVTYIEV